MNHAELSRDLALALGYPPKSVRVKEAPPVRCQVWPTKNWTIGDGPFHRWWDFDYRDPTVVVPLIELLMVKHDIDMWLAIDGKFHMYGSGVTADTLAEAVARAVIALRSDS